MFEFPWQFILALSRWCLTCLLPAFELISCFSQIDFFFIFYFYIYVYFYFYECLEEFLNFFFRKLFFFFIYLLKFESVDKEDFGAISILLDFSFNAVLLDSWK